MKTQDFKNHMKVAPRAYYVGIITSLIVIVFSLICCKGLADGWDGMLLPFLLIDISVGLLLIGYFARAFALKAQDRAIRAEENLRHFVLSGKLLDSRVKISQVIALRFASDEEFIALAIKAVDENLSNKEIKQLIKNWRGDYYRV